MMKLSEARTRVDELKGERKQALKQIEEYKQEISDTESEESHILEALSIIQTVALATQQELEYHVSEIASLANQAIFPDPYELCLDFVLKRNRSEAILSFQKKGGEKINPLNATGGGAVDVVCFALRASLWSLRRPKSRATLILDEPFKNINDPTRQLHEKAALMLKRVSEMTGLQIIVVTLCPELIDVGDRVFTVTQRKGISQVEET